MLTLKQFYIAQMLKGTNVAYPARETGDDGDEPVVFDD